jgi:Phage tail tube protein, GTA-gp10
MAVNGEIEIKWGDGEHKFNIAKLKCILELEEKCGTGIAEILKRVNDGVWRFNDIRETLRLGLIGAGMTPDKALTLINRYCDDRPWVENVLPVQAILFAAMFGIPQDDPLTKKAETERAKEDPSMPTMEGSSVPSSTDSAPPSDLTRVN